MRIGKLTRSGQSESGRSKVVTATRTPFRAPAASRGLPSPLKIVCIQAGSVAARCLATVTSEVSTLAATEVRSDDTAPLGVIGPDPVKVPNAIVPIDPAGGERMSVGTDGSETGSAPSNTTRS